MQQQLNETMAYPPKSPINKTSLTSRPAPAFFDLSSSGRGSGPVSDDMDHTEEHVDDMNNDDLYSPRELLQHPQLTVPLRAMVKFAENCQRRKVMEQLLR
jgi:hypothetical protein